MTDTLGGLALDRTALGLPRPPERIVHLGLGAFHRAHQAWYTQHALDASEWGIVAFTGRSSDLAETLQRQDDLYTLVERGADGDDREVIGSIVRAVPGDDVLAFAAAVARPSTALLTLTITEAGYRLDSAGRLDRDDPDVQADLRRLARLSDPTVRLETVAPSTAPARVVLALEARRRAASGPLSIVSCDNIPANGDVTRGVLFELAQTIGDRLTDWMHAQVDYVSTSVDRITPRVEPPDVDELIRTSGCADMVPVITEPFSDWALAGRFPAGRPAWESAGARFVEDVGPWETRKLWMLNGAHTLLSAMGPHRGHHTVAEAILDPRLRHAVNALWDEDERHLRVDVTDYRHDLVERFANARIEHRLAQIAQGGASKVRFRIAPVARLELAAGRDALGAATAIGGWIGSVLRGDAPKDPAADAAARAADPIGALLRLVDPHLAADAPFAATVARLAR